MEALVDEIAAVLDSAAGTADGKWKDIAETINTEYDKSVVNWPYLVANMSLFACASVAAAFTGCMLAPLGPITDERVLRSFEYLLESMALIVAMMFANEASAYTFAMNSWETCLNAVYAFHVDLQMHAERMGLAGIDSHVRHLTARALLLAIGTKSHAVRRKQAADGAGWIVRCCLPVHEASIFDDRAMLTSKKRLVADCRTAFGQSKDTNAELYRIGTAAVSAVVETQRRLSEQSVSSGATTYMYASTLVVMVYMIVQSDGDLYSGVMSAYIVALALLFPVTMVGTGSVKSYSFKIRHLPGFRSQAYFTGADACLEECVDEIAQMSESRPPPTRALRLGPVQARDRIETRPLLRLGRL
jgi:hypothetical protein